MSTNEQGIPVLQPVVGTVAGSTLPILAASGVLPGVAASSLAIPIIGAAIAGITLAVGLWLNRKGPKQKIATTEIVNDAEKLLKQNLDAWNASEKNVAEKAQYLSNFVNIWNQVIEACSNDAYGDPGHTCIEDRMPQGMTIQANGKTYSGNGRWNWFVYYYDPVNGFNPSVSVSSLFQDPLATLNDITGGLSLPMILAGLAVVVGGFMVFED